MDGDSNLLWFLSAWVVLLSVTWVASLWLWRRRGRDEAASREALLYRIGQLEERLRQHEDLQTALGRELLLLQDQLKQQQFSKAISPAPQATSEVVPVKDAQTREILRRSKIGQSILQIAREMDIGQGEVQLVLNLDGGSRSRHRDTE